MTDNFYVLLEPGHPAERIHGILDTLEADIIVTNRKNEKKAAKLEFAGKIIYIEDLLETQVTDEIRDFMRSVPADCSAEDSARASRSSDSCRRHRMI